MSKLEFASTKPPSAELTIESNAASKSITIVSSFSIIEDWVNQLIKGIPAEIYAIKHSTIIPRATDPHMYQTTPHDSAVFSHADLIIKVGHHFEGTLDEIVKASGTKAVCVDVGNVQNIHLRRDKVVDPHIWHDVKNARLIVAALAKILCDLMPKTAAYIKKNAVAYDEKLQRVDAMIAKQFRKIPIDRRKVITTHDAFYYYGAAYGVQFLAPVGFSTEMEADPKAITSLIEQIKKDNIRALFFENLANRNVVRQIAEETKIAINEDAILYTDSLSQPHGPAPTYVLMMLYNTRMIVKAFKGK